MKPHVLLFLLSGVLLSGCLSPRPQPAGAVMMPPPAPETAPAHETPPTDIEAEAPPADTGLRFTVEGRPMTLEQLQAPGQDRSVTVFVHAAPWVPHSRVAEALVQLHQLGYLVGFAADEAPAP